MCVVGINKNSYGQLINQRVGEVGINLLNCIGVLSLERLEHIVVVCQVSSSDDRISGIHHISLVWKLLQVTKRPQGSVEVDKRRNMPMRTWRVQCQIGFTNDPIQHANEHLIALMPNVIQKLRRVKLWMVTGWERGCMFLSSVSFV